MYAYSDGEWTVVGPEEGYKDLDEYVILDSIDNCPVTKIAPFAFYNYDYKCTSITIPNTIREIGKYAFYQLLFICIHLLLFILHLHLLASVR